jgi:hypothetical protein
MFSAREIIAAFNAHMQQSGVRNSGWYVGVTSNIRGRLFGDHRVSEQNGYWIWRRAHNDTVARSAEAAYHRAGCQGSGGGGDHTAVYVYAYVVTPTTVE